MAKIKSYSDLQQSKKLAEILPLESADLWWDTNEFEPRFEKHYHQYMGMTISPIPCWSLAALLSVLPDDCGINKENGKYVASYLVSDECGTYTSDNPIDACVAMIGKLNELKML